MLKIYKDRVVIEGHEQTKEQCETMTLLANALKDSKDFKVVDYKNGYAEFEKVGKSNELKFVATSDWNIKVNGATVTLQVSGESTFNENERTWVGQALVNKGTYSIQDNLVLWNDNNILQANGTNVSSTDIISNTIEYTTKQSGGGSSMKSVDLTTLGGWNDLTDGTHNITIVAKGTGYQDSDESDSVQVTKSSGETWVLNQQISYASEPISSVINFTSNNENFEVITIDSIRAGSLKFYYNSSNFIEVFSFLEDAWTTKGNYRTIILDKPATGDLLTWLQSNGTKQ